MKASSTCTVCQCYSDSFHWTGVILNTCMMPNTTDPRYFIRAVSAVSAAVSNTFFIAENTKTCVEPCDAF